MPIGVGEGSGEFRAIRGEYCNFTKINGVETLCTKTGVDLVHIAEGLHERLTQFKEIFDKLSDRLDAVEAGGVTTSMENVTVNSDELDDVKDEIEALKERIISLEKLPKARHGRDGKHGAEGAPGRDANEFCLGDLKDVDVKGIQDKAILEWSAKKNKFVVAMEE